MLKATGTLLDCVPCRHTEMWKRQEGSDSDIFVMDMLDGHLYQLNATAASLWTLMDGQRTVGEVVSACLDAFEVDNPDEARASLLECISDLEKRDLIFFKDTSQSF